MGLRTGTPMPPLDGVDHWINGCLGTIPGGFSAVVFHFWAISCPACKANMPAVRALRLEFEAAGVLFVAVHSPRMPDDVNDERVCAVAAEIGVSEPCAVDNSRVLADRFELGGMWPYYFLYDSEGNLKLRGAGGVGLKLVTASLRRLIPSA